MKLLKWLTEGISVKTQVIRDYRQESDNALSIFRTTLDKLNQVNCSILLRDNIVSEEIKALEEEKNRINAIAMENGRIINQINKILK